MSSPQGGKWSMTVLDNERPVAVVTREDRTRPVLDFIQELLQGPAAGTLPELLREMANAFAVRAAGIAAPLYGPSVIQQHHAADDTSLPLRFPWEDVAEWQERLQDQALAVTFAEPHASWLVTAVWPADHQGWRLWLQDPPGRSWTT